MYNIAVQAHYITVQCTKYMVHEMQYANMEMSLLLFDVVVQWQWSFTFYTVFIHSLYFDDKHVNIFVRPWLMITLSHFRQTELIFYKSQDIM